MNELRVLLNARCVLAVVGLMLSAVTMPGLASADDAIATASYACKDGKMITATYYPGKVDLVLSDGRKLSVPQALSANGARYASADESFVFWNVGKTAFITEGDPSKPTFEDCNQST